ncbi:MAG: thymidine phosphorylase [Planctomycetes bacterium]|nr:thymidine phosphorylase [Planctomycetota bacterium]
MIQEWLQARRAGEEQSEKALQAFVMAVVQGSITRAQAAAWLAFVYFQGMRPAETVAFTRAMTESGETLSWPGIDGPFIDKHSTGGVGDKVSLVLAPLWAELGLRVPMLSGRGLGMTGGTLDKLEAIHGYQTDLQPQRLHELLSEVGCFINGQTARIAPADRILYALRDETCTVESIPLITASILSKKLVEGIDRLVLDVKWGSGAFMKTRDDAQSLADSLVTVGNGAGVETTAHLTDMTQPLGLKIGNALEVEEAEDCLRGEGPEDLTELCVLLSGEGDRAREVLRSGAALPRWHAMVRAHGGDPDRPLKGEGCDEQVVLASTSGEVTECDAGELGWAAHRLGAGRTHADEAVHFGVGLILHAKRGDHVQQGQPLVTIRHTSCQGLDEAQSRVAQAFRLQ